MEELFASLIQDFVDETGPIAREASGTAFGIEAAWRFGEAGREPLRSIRGGLHTIKGNSSMMGLSTIAKLAHSLEDLIDGWEARPGPGTAWEAGRLIEGCDLIERAIVAAGRGETVEGEVTAFLGKPTSPMAAESSGTTPAADPIQPDGLAGKVGGQGPASFAESPGGVTVRDGVVDELLELIGESSIGHGELQRLQARFARGQLEVGDLALMGRVVDGFSRTFSRMRDHVLGMRLSPIGALFRRYKRYVRDLGSEHGQPVDLVIEGADVAVDRAVISRLSELLIHIVRNAVAHGLESPEERARAGKSPRARILLGARVGHDRVRVLVADDGRGLSLRAISAKAAEQGIDVSGMGDREIARLIFHAGISTASRVTSLSGRGMGLDVVACVVQSLGGTVDVRSREGMGTVFILDLPVTITLRKVLLFGADSEVFALPAAFVERTLAVGDRDLVPGPEGPSLLFRGARLPTMDAGRLLGCHGLAGGWTRPYALVARKGNAELAILVDWLSPVQELLVKPLDPVFSGCALAAGATVTGKGRVVPVLEIAEIMARANTVPPRADTRFAGEATFHDI